MRRIPLLITLGLFVLATVRTPAAESDGCWLDRLNFYRATAALPPVTEEPALSGAVQQHARYMVMHGSISHSENPRQRWATPEGAAAALVSNLAASASATEPESWAVDVWMQAPFHALGILDPALRHVGFGIDRREQRKRIQTAAGLDVIRGRLASPPPEITYPIVWPANGTVVPLVEHVGETPNPLSSCRGYGAPAGLPLIVQIGAGLGVPRVTGSWLGEDGEWVDHCVFDEGTYRNGDGRQQRLGRSILAARDAIVLIPRRPLHPGSTYRAVIDVDGQRIDWSFSIAKGT